MVGDADDPYAALGVARSATQAEIKAAYQTLIRKYHPDLHQQNPLADLAQQRLVHINAAYELLSDPMKRATYDAGFRAWTRGRGARERRAQAAAGGWRIGRVGWVIPAILAIPIAFRVTVMLVRLLRLLFVRLLGAGGAIGGGRVAAVVVIACVVVLVVAWRRRRSGNKSGPSGTPK